MYRKLATILIFILCLMFTGGTSGSMFVNKALAETPSGSYSITSMNAFSSSFRITLQEISNAAYFNVYKKSNNTLVNSVPISINNALNSMPAVYSDITDLEVRVYSDSAGTNTAAEFTLNSANQLVLKGSTVTTSPSSTPSSPTVTSSSNSTISPATGSFNENKSAKKEIPVPKTLNDNTQSSTANAATTLVPATAKSASGNTITVTVNGTPVVFDQPPVIISGRTITPMRAIFEAMGAQVNWDGAKQTVTVTKGGTTIKVKIGNSQATVNDAAKTLDVPAQIINNRTLVPIRFISESLGARVDWTENSHTVTINQ